MVFKRLRDITLATIHEGLDALENPVAMLNQYLRDMEAEIEKAEAAVVKQTLIEKKFAQYRDEAQRMVDKRMRQATLAVEAGEEELARRALYEKKRYAEKVKQYEQMAQDARQKVLEMKEQLKEMKEKYMKRFEDVKDLFESYENAGDFINDWKAVVYAKAKSERVLLVHDILKEKNLGITARIMFKFQQEYLNQEYEEYMNS